MKRLMSWSRSVSKLKHNLGILNPEDDVALILEIRKKLDQLSHNAYQAILERR